MSYNNYYDQPRPAHDDFPPHRPTFRSWKVTDGPILSGKPKEPEPFKPFQRRGKRLARHNAILAARNSSSDEDTTTSSFLSSLEDSHNCGTGSKYQPSPYQLALEAAYNRIERENAFQTIQPASTSRNPFRREKTSQPTSMDHFELEKASQPASASMDHFDHFELEKASQPTSMDHFELEKASQPASASINHSEPEDVLQPAFESSKQPEKDDAQETLRALSRHLTPQRDEVQPTVEHPESESVNVPTDPEISAIIPSNPLKTENVPDIAEHSELSMNERLLTTLESLLDARKGIERLEEKISTKMSQPGLDNGAGYVRVAIDFKIPFSRPDWDFVDWKLLWWIWVLLMFVLGWVFLETAMCATFCKPQYSSTGRYKSSDPIWGYAIPWKVDEWAGNTISRAWWNYLGY